MHTSTVGTSGPATRGGYGVCHATIFTSGKLQNALRRLDPTGVMEIAERELACTPGFKAGDLVGPGPEPHTRAYLRTRARVRNNRSPAACLHMETTARCGSVPNGRHLVLNLTQRGPSC